MTRSHEARQGKPEILPWPQRRAPVVPTPEQVRARDPRPDASPAPVDPLRNPNKPRLDSVAAAVPVLAMVALGLWRLWL